MNRVSLMTHGRAAWKPKDHTEKGIMGIETQRGLVEQTWEQRDRPES